MCSLLSENRTFIAPLCGIFQYRIYHTQIMSVWLWNVAELTMNFSRFALSSRWARWSCLDFQPLCFLRLHSSKASFLLLLPTRIMSVLIKDLHVWPTYRFKRDITCKFHRIPSSNISLLHIRGYKIPVHRALKYFLRPLSSKIFPICSLIFPTNVVHHYAYVFMGVLPSLGQKSSMPSKNWSRAWLV